MSRPLGAENCTINILHRRTYRVYSMYGLIDPAMTDAERRAWGRVALELECRRLIFVDGRSCKLSPKGKKRLRELAAKLNR